MKKLITLLTLLLAAHAVAVTLEQNISREDPKFDSTVATLTVGRDGKVYLGSVSNPGYILRVSRDGADRLGGDAVYAMHNATANADGVIASANAHFNHSINIYDARFQQIALCSEFLVNDSVEWDAPGGVEAGPSGDFYGLDQHRNRILRVNTTGKVVQVYTLTPATLAPNRPAWSFRVCEPKQVFDVLTYDGVLRCVGFDGQKRWELKPGAMPFAVDDDGVIYLMPNGTVIKRISPEGHALPDIRLHMGDLAPEGPYAITAVAIFGKDFLIKRAHPTELFQVYDLATGQRKAVVSSHYEKFTAELPGTEGPIGMFGVPEAPTMIWTAGQPVPVKIGLESSPKVDHPAPDWRVWAAPLGDSVWHELKLEHDHVMIPADWAGLYQIKIAPMARPEGASEYLLQAVAEVRAPGSAGTINIWTPQNRVWFGRGEEVPVSVLLRTDAPGAAAPPAAPQPVRVELRQDNNVLWSADLSLHANTTSQCSLTSALTRQLAPGRYMISATPLASAATAPSGGAAAATYTSVPQPLRIGPGMAAASPFRVVLYGDYAGFFSTASFWDFPDTADQMLDGSLALGVNQYVNRTSFYPLDFINNMAGRPLIGELTRHMGKDPHGVAPEKVEFGFPQEHTLAAYGAHGIRETELLVTMDGGLPIGTGYDKRTPEQFAKNIQLYTAAFDNLPAFHGWTWAANWWADTSLGFKNPKQKAAFDKALTRAKETGEWDPILDTIGDERINWQVDAQAAFGKDLHDVSKDAVTAASGPYRRPEVYPPISFANVSEVDLHYQAEQITTPSWTPHAVDYYQRPGKPTWIHPELMNDNGTGDQILTMLWTPLMRGVGGIGNSGNMPNWGPLPSDSRSGYGGTASVFMAIDGFARRYGAWLTTLRNDDRVAIVVSRRQVKVDSWHGVGGEYFTRLWEAYQACLLAHYPATFLYPEDVTPQTWSQFKVLLLVDQRFELDPELVALFAEAKKHNVAVFADQTCRESLVKDFTPLPVAFNHIEELAGFNVDDAYWTYPQVLLADAPIVAKALATACKPVATVDQPQVLVSERRGGDARVFWVVNNTYPTLDPGYIWRVGNGVSTREPVIAHVSLPVGPDEVVYDLLTQQEVKPDFDADLRYTHARVYVVLPRKIKELRLKVEGKFKPGEELKWSASVSDVDAALPMDLRLITGDGEVLEEQFTTTDHGSLFMPINGAQPAELKATELISGKEASWSGTGFFNSDSELRQPPAIASFGPRLRDLAVSRDGNTVLLNAFDRGNNLYALDAGSGKPRWQKRVGHHYAYAPAAAGNGFVAQGYDFNTGEGYHLYQLDSHGDASRRFALPGLPARLTNWAFSPILADHINNFTAAPDGSWVAAAGNLALAVWSRDGKLLWSDDWSQTSRDTRVLLAPDDHTLLVAKGIELTAHDAATGHPLWSLNLATTGDVLGLAASPDGKTIAARASTQSGRVFVIQNKAVIGTLPTTADETVFTPDGSHLAVVAANQLKWYDADGGLRWLANFDTTIRFVRVSADGARIAATTELGDLRILNTAGDVLHEEHLPALAAPAWLPDGDLLLATWMGDVCRLDSNYHERWRVKLTGDPSDVPTAATAVAPDKTPTARLTSWSNAEPTPLPLTPNLIDPKAVLVTPMLGNRPAALQQSAATLFDGKSDPPTEPWLSWQTIGAVDSGWSGAFSLVFDTFRTQLRVTAITFVEDPAHPESWLRDARLEYWDAAHEQWVFAQYLTADAQVHTHKLVKPIEAAKFRITKPAGDGWPQSNLRFAEVVFHGESLGMSHPDVLANKPVAVLFDERESDLASVMMEGGGSFQHGGAYNGGSCIRVEPDRIIGSGYQPPFGHATPNWDFEIVEKPAKPGQYRWLQFAYKAANPGTRGLSVRVGPEWPNGGVIADIGEAYPLREGFWVRQKVAGEPTTDWKIARVDLWAAAKKDFRIRSISLAAYGGRGLFDQILLARTETDLPAPKVEEKKDILDSDGPAVSPGTPPELP